MKILTIHADYIEFEAKKKAFKDAEQGIQEGKHRIDECLVIFTAVEKRDESNTQAVLDRYVQEIEAVASQVKATNIVLYPYAHLSSQLSSPAIAEKLLKDAEKLLQGKYKVSRAPFGWYKSFTIANKGHPLSELSREFSAEPTTSLKKENVDEPFVFDKRQLSKEEQLKLSAVVIAGKAVSDLYPNTEIGSCGFYHDQAYIDIANIKLKNEDLPKIEKLMLKIIETPLTFKKITSKEIKSTLQQEIQKDCPSSLPYQVGDITIIPLVKDPFISSSKEIATFKILSTGSAYWKNNSNNQQLTRIYLVAFASEKDFVTYLKQKEEAENRSHLKIGREQNLFVISEQVGPGLPLLAPKGTIIRNEIINFLWQLHKNKGYQQVWTPHIAKDILYKTSGHWDKFGDELFKVKGKIDDFVMKPMNCPHHMQIFDSFSLSYRDMPVRFFEPATVYRDEKSGQLLGLSRVRSITQDDGHLFCRISQITEEVQTIVKIIHQFYHTMQLDKDYFVSLSVRGDDKSKYLGTDEVWHIAEKALENAAKELKLPYQRREGEAAFYGPKLDFMFKDALGRQWQLATIQCDFNLPKRFNLSFMNEKGEKEQPVVIHRAISGSLERFMSIVIEHFAGKFPLWLSPVQVKILTVTDRNIPFAKKVQCLLQEQDLRVELDDASETIGKKVRNAQMEKINYIVTIGDKEMEKNTLAIRTREGAVEFEVPIRKFIDDLLVEIKDKVIRNS